MSADAATLSSVETAQVYARPGPLRGRRRATRTVGAVVLNVLLYVIAFMCTFPFLWMLATALKPEDNAVTNNFFFGYSLTWSNFKQAWDFFPFGQFMVNSFIYSFGVTGVVLVASTTGGYAFARLKFPGREKLFRLRGDITGTRGGDRDPAVLARHQAPHLQYLPRADLPRVLQRFRHLFHAPVLPHPPRGASRLGPHGRRH